jgi:GMP synthase-like glutamine amidotransferase
MKIGLLVCGALTPDLVEKFGCLYEDFFVEALLRVDQTLSFQSYYVFDGQFPQSISECDAWLITGSRNGVYENLPWMLTLQDFIRDSYKADIPLVGICFGHQIMAQALGGEVVKANSGWGLGCQSYDVLKIINALQVDKIKLFAIHQDQVVNVPVEAQVFLKTQHCPNAGLIYKGRALSFQPHPEFSFELESFLIKRNIGEGFSKEVGEEALESMTGAAVDNEAIFKLIVTFFYLKNGLSL